MTGLPYYRKIEDLPRTIPIFPLPGALLLPRGTLPLNIFEPRYVAMVEDSIRSERLIGMIQPRVDADDPGMAACFDIGCAGRITQFAETEDGRFLISLSGIARFKVVRELALMESGYRLVEADFTPFETDMRRSDKESAFDRENLICLLRAYFVRKKIEVDWDAVSKANNESLVSALSMVCPFQPQEKQLLLEARDFEERGEILAALLTMDEHADDQSTTTQ